MWNYSLSNHWPFMTQHTNCTASEKVSRIIIIIIMHIIYNHSNFLHCSSTSVLLDVYIYMYSLNMITLIMNYVYSIV